MSALMQPTTVRTLELTYALLGIQEAQMRRLYFRWLGLVLFSRFSHSHITKLIYSDNQMSESDVAGIQEILAARNPFPLLRFSDSIPENARPEPKMVRVLVDHAWIQPITARLEDYKQQNEVNTPTVNKGGLYWLVYERPKSNAVEILVPGFGFCVMNLEDLEIVDPVDEMMPKVQPCVRELRMLMFHEDESEILGLLSLLKVAGPSLTRFWFFPKNWSVLDDVLVHAVVQHCPVLRHLSLVKTRISSLQLVVDAFEKYGRAWESLELSAATIHEGDDISVFTDALSDSNSQIAGGLYAFRLPLLLGACRWGGTFGTPAEVFHVFFAPREESKEYLVARAKIIEEMITDDETRQACIDQVLPVTVELDLEDQNEAKPFIESTVEIYEAQKLWGASKDQECPFRYDGVRLPHHLFYLEQTEPCLRFRHGFCLAFRKLALWHHHESKDWCLATICRHFFSSARPDIHDIEVVEFSGHMSDIAAASLSSSLMVTRSVHSLCFERSRWRVPRNVFRSPRMSYWLGLALFSRFSYSGVTKLTLDGESLTTSNAAAMHEICQAQNPFPLLRQNKNNRRRLCIESAPDGSGAPTRHSSHKSR